MKRLRKVASICIITMIAIGLIAYILYFRVFVPEEKRCYICRWRASERADISHNTDNELKEDMETIIERAVKGNWSDSKLDELQEKIKNYWLSLMEFQPLCAKHLRQYKEREVMGSVEQLIYISPRREHSMFAD